MNQLTDFIQVFDNVLSKDACEKIVLGCQKNEHLFKSYDTEGYRFDQIDLNEVPEMQALAVNFAKAVVPLAKSYFKSVGVSDFVDVQGFEHVRIKRYKANSGFEFKPHIDIVDRASAARYLIFILYLNDNDGETHFENLGISFKPKVGSVIAFPPFWMFPHSGKTPTTGDKFIMMTSLQYEN